MKKKIVAAVLGLVVSSNLLAKENCALTMLLEPDFYEISSPHVVRTDHVHVVATVDQKKPFPIYQTLSEDGKGNVQHDLGDLRQISFDLPNVPGLVFELDKATREDHKLYVDFSWLSDDCADFKDFEIRSGQSRHFKYNSEVMSYKLHAILHAIKEVPSLEVDSEL